MVSYNAKGYDELRSYIYNNFNWWALLNDSGTELLRWDLLSNANVSIASDAAANPIEYTITVTGQDLKDAGNSLPQTLAKQEIYVTSGGSTPAGDDQLRDANGNAITATVEADNDEVQVTFYQETPPQ